MAQTLLGASERGRGNRSLVGRRSVPRRGSSGAQVVGPESAAEFANRAAPILEEGLQVPSPKRMVGSVFDESRCLVAQFVLVFASWTVRSQIAIAYTAKRTMPLIRISRPVSL